MTRCGAMLIIWKADARTISFTPMAANGISSAIGWRRDAAWIRTTGRPRLPPNCSTTATAFTSGNCWRNRRPALGRQDEARRCRAKLDQIRPLIHRAFYDPSKQTYVLDEQSYQCLPLFAGVVPPAERDAVLRKLENGILLRRGGHLDTGMLGTYFLIQYLPTVQRDDLLFTIVNQKTYPGWGYMLEQGATTMWEQWNGYWSQIHSCFTSIAGWFHNGLAGIQPDPAAPGFKHFIIRPAVVGDLTWVKSSYRSIHGMIVSNWRREKDVFTLDVTIPANTTATVYVPDEERRIGD